MEHAACGFWIHRNQATSMDEPSSIGTINEMHAKTPCAIGERRGRVLKIIPERRIRNALVGLSPAFFGFAFVKAWATLALPYYSLSSFNGDMPSVLSLLPFDAMFALLSCCLAIASVRIVPLRLKKALFPLSTGSLIASSLFLLAIAYLKVYSTSLMLVSVMLGAFGLIGMSVLWVDFYSLFNPLRSLFLNAGSIVASIILRYCTAESSPPRIFVVLIIFAVLSAILYRISWSSSSSERPRTHIGKVRATFPYKAAIFVASYSFAYGLSSPFVAGIEGVTELRIIPALFVVALAFVDMKRADVKLLYSIAFPLMVCGLLIAALIPGLSPNISFFLLDSSYATMSMMIIAIACGVSYSLGTSAAWIFSLLVTIQFVARSMGQLANHLLATMSSEPAIQAAVSILAIMFIIIASLVMASEKGLFTTWGSHQTDPEAVNAEYGGVPFIQMRIDGICDTYGLTQREADVVKLLAQGKSNSVIANEMFIAVGTVKAHIQHVYQKLGIHTRKELFELIGKDSDKEAR